MSKRRSVSCYDLSLEKQCSVSDWLLLAREHWGRTNQRHYTDACSATSFSIWIADVSQRSETGLEKAAEIEPNVSRAGRHVNVLGKKRMFSSFKPRIPLRGWIGSYLLPLFIVRLYVFHSHFATSGARKTTVFMGTKYKVFLAPISTPAPWPEPINAVKQHDVSLFRYVGAIAFGVCECSR